MTAETADERDVKRLAAERDRAREECGHEKAMRASQREEMMGYFTSWQAAKKAIERVEALHARDDVNGVAYCDHCLGPGETGGAEPWPCYTIKALRGEAGEMDA